MNRIKKIAALILTLSMVMGQGVSAETQDAIVSTLSQENSIETEDGLYQYIYTPRGRQFTYLDYATMKQEIVYFENQNGGDKFLGALSHLEQTGQEGPTSLSEIVGTKDGKNVFINHITEQGNRAILSMDLSNGETKTIFSTEENNITLSFIGVDSQYLYFTESDYSVGTHSVIRLLIEGGEAKTITTLTDEDGHVTGHTHGNRIIIAKYNNDQQQSERGIELFSLDANSGEIKPITDAPIPIDYNYVGMYHHDSFFILSLSDDEPQTLKRVNLETGETTSAIIDSDNFVDGMSGIDKEHIMLMSYNDGGGYEIGTTKDAVYQYYDITSGRLSSATLMYEHKMMWNDMYSSPMLPIAEVNDGFLVMYDSEFATITDRSEESDWYAPYTFRKAAFISKEDYFAGNANFIPIDQSQLLELVNRI